MKFCKNYQTTRTLINQQRLLIAHQKHAWSQATKQMKSCDKRSTKPSWNINCLFALLLLILQHQNFKTHAAISYHKHLGYHSNSWQPCISYTHLYRRNRRVRWFGSNHKYSQIVQTVHKPMLNTNQNLKDQNWNAELEIPSDQIGRIGNPSLKKRLKTEEDKHVGKVKRPNLWTRSCF